MNTPNSKNEILLEAGTNELEIVVFRIGEDFYGINVAKVREIIRAGIDIVPVPDGHPSIPGVINLRDRIIPVVNLAKHLNINTEYDAKASRIIVTEFNGVHVGFWVNEVTRIHRISWKEVEQPKGLVQSKDGYAVGVIKIEGKVLFLLDFEKVTSIINPEAGLEGVEGKELIVDEVEFDRSTKKILVAEDSPFISKLLISYIEKAGYNASLFHNGQEAWDALESITQLPDFKKIDDYYQLIVTDIEMPQMDGLHLIKRVKENQKLQTLPCIVFSSMITAELSLKCKKIGAADQITKPEIEGLVRMVDKHILK